MPRFFVDPSKVNGDRILIDTEDVSHISRVLRLGIGDCIEICDTCGFDYTAQIMELTQNAVICQILKKCKSDSEPKTAVTLYQGLPKGTKMDYIIQKTTELGITRIVPVVMARCVVKLENRKAEEKKVSRWRKIAEEAAKQSGRGIVPTVEMPMSFSQAIREMGTAELAFTPYECEQEQTLKMALKKSSVPKTVSFLIGPEGGFDPAEAEQLKQADIPLITLGRRILRTETAGEAVLAMTIYELEG